MKTCNVTRTTRMLALAAGMLCAAGAQGGIIYSDSFQTYPVQSPAPNPLTNGPAGGQWWFVDPTPPTIGANEHRIFDSGTGGSALQTRCWISSADNAKITNAITLPALPVGPGPHTFTLSFLAATDTTTAGRRATFLYEIGSSGGTLQFVSGGNLDNSQVFTGLSGYGQAPEGAKGKTDDRKFQVVFTAANLTTADKIFVSLTRVTNSGAAGAFIAIDDVSLALNFGPPVVVQEPVSQTVSAGDPVAFSAVFTNFPDAYQWYKNDVAIPGATSTSYTIPFVTKPDEGSYRLWATNSEGFAGTAPAILTVNDSTAPTLASARGLLTLEHAQIRFSEPVEALSATNASNYSINGGVTVNGASLVDPFTVELYTTSLNPGATYTATVSAVQDLGGNTIQAGSTINFSTPALVVSSARYNAGTTATHPLGPPDPASAAGGYWSHTTNLNDGMTTNAVIDDLGTGLNAWAVSDQNSSSTGNILDYRLAIDNDSDNLAFSNGWRFLFVSRMPSYPIGASPVVLYSHVGLGRRYGMVFSINANNELTASLLGGATYALPGDPLAYHTHVIIYDPATSNATYYCDGQRIVAGYTGQANTAYNGLVFGTGSSTATGEMNFNRVQLDVVGGTQPVVVAHPQSSTNGVGQKVTFSASFTPFVAAYQWLSNNVVIPGAVSNSYTTDFITLGMNGTQYRCRALHALGNVETDAATLTVTSDTEPPTVVGTKGSLLLDRVLITYSEPVLEFYATNVANYVWVNPGVTNLFARLVDPLTVELRTTSQAANSNYTVRISNVRDTSNLPIANNTPASFKTAKLAVFARYDAGNTTTRPDGPPDPATPEGGSWVVNIGTDPLLITNAVVNDFGTGLHAWEVTDQTSGASQFIQFNAPMTAEQQAAARANGWVMSIRSRFSTDFGSSFSVMSQAGDQAGNRVLLWFDIDAGGSLVVRPQGSADLTLTDPGMGILDYHLHQVVWDPAKTNASYYFDGQLVLSDWPGDVSPFTYAGVQWGTGSSANQGSMNFNLVEFKVVEPPSRPYVAAVLNGANLDVYYTGILETAAAMGQNVTWTAVATNTTAGTNVFSVPATGQQYFRAKAAE